MRSYMGASMQMERRYQRANTELANSAKGANPVRPLKSLLVAFRRCFMAEWTGLEPVRALQLRVDIIAEAVPSGPLKSHYLAPNVASRIASWIAPSSATR